MLILKMKNQLRLYLALEMDILVLELQIQLKKATEQLLMDSLKPERSLMVKRPMAMRIIWKQSLLCQIYEI